MSENARRITRAAFAADSADGKKPAILKHEHGAKGVIGRWQIQLSDNDLYISSWPEQEPSRRGQRARGPEAKGQGPRTRGVVGGLGELDESHEVYI